MTSLNFTWGPPEPSVLNFSDCSTAIALWQFYEGNPWLSYPFSENVVPVFWRGMDPSVALLDGLQDYLHANSLPQPRPVELWQWLADFRLAQTVVRLTRRDCTAEMCTHLGWEGNSDIAGLGMLASYLVQATLVSIYIPILLAIRVDTSPEKSQRRPWICRSFVAVQHSTSTFLNVSFVFCISMLFSALVTFARLAPLHLGGFRRSTWALTLLLPYSSVLPVAMLHLATHNKLRRARGRIVLWTVVLGLVSTVLILSVIVALKDLGISSTNAADRWENSCTDLNFLLGMVILAWIIGLMLTLCIGSYVVRAIISSLQPRSKSPQGRWGRSLWLAGIFGAFFLMWACLGGFMHFQISSWKAGGPGNKDVEWSFGQILALATWVPVVVEFAYVWWERPEEALSGRLMAPYEVVKV